MAPDQQPGPTIQDWADAPLHLNKLNPPNPEAAIYQLSKRMVINGVEHVQFVWFNQQQLRSIAIEHGL